MHRSDFLVLVAILLMFGDYSQVSPGFQQAAAADLGKLLVKENFEDGADRWRPTDPAAWRVENSPRGKMYSLFQQSNYAPPVRSPLNFALLKDLTVSDFSLEAELQSTCKDYDHRDMCLVFGYQDRAHFYYVHLGKKTDDHANQIFIVDNEPRRKISTKTTPGTPWDDRWHHVKLERSVADGAISMYFDDMENPVMTAADKTFLWGQIGIGSFDDTGNFANIVLRGQKVERN